MAFLLLRPLHYLRHLHQFRFVHEPPQAEISVRGLHPRRDGGVRGRPALMIVVFRIFI
jgi:hypothetical protein